MVTGIAWRRLLAVARVHGFGVDLHGLFPLPANAALGVFQDDALLQQLLADLVGAREILAPSWPRCVPRSALRPRRRTAAPALHGGLRARRRWNRSVREIRARPAALPARNSPASMAVLVSRTYSKTAASASAVFRSSSRLVDECLRAPAPCARPAARSRLRRNLSVSRRSLKLRSRSMAVAADFSPSNVKLSFLRYGTEASR